MIPKQDRPNKNGEREEAGISGPVTLARISASVEGGS